MDDGMLPMSASESRDKSRSEKGNAQGVALAQSAMAAVAIALAMALLATTVWHWRAAPVAALAPVKDQSWITANKGDLERKPPRLIPLAKQPTPAPPPAVVAPAPPAPVVAAVQMPPARDDPPEADEPPLTAPRGPVHRVRHVEGGGDVCSRHGGRKVETHNGRSWRCVYGRR
jgi:hypothetical protein